jgi:hypothetical protein
MLIRYDLPSGGANSPGTRYRDRVPASGQGETTTVDLKGQLPFPDPVAALSLRDCVAFRAVDDENQPVLIISDGVTTLALECGLRGASDQIVAAANRIAEACQDFATSVENSFE